MKHYRILKDFNGSQDGHDFHKFIAGATVPLSNDLAAIAVKEGWAELATLEAIVAEVVGLDAPVPDGKLNEVLTISPDDRETKIVPPEEPKPSKFKKGKK
ncbi:hypothetical protein [Zavarzinella formosa]|uniref:hypothetical protein n=1 Tax=Zavarzinella formosa TaxID=360055 RepID=UPI00030B639A|nr:hypothetical protein [Zavarzinella formosa]